MDLDLLSRQLCTLISEQTQSAGELFALLQKEYDALKENDVEAIENVAEQKNRIVDSIQQLGRQRQQLVQDYGFSPGNASRTEFLGSFGSTTTEDLSRRWENLDIKIRECQDQNQVNGRLIEVSQQHVHRALSLLRGEENQGAGYGPKSGGLGSQSFGRV